MTINQRIKKAIAPFGDPVVAGIYTGTEESYYTFNYRRIPTNFANNKPTFYRVLIQLHYFCPLDVNPMQRKKETMEALVESGFFWPEEIDATESSQKGNADQSQHFVFEFEAIEAVKPMERN